METRNGHIAPALSCVEIIEAVYNIKTNDDKFILSKGHGCLALYVKLQELGYNPDIYKGHPDIDIENGIECTTGSLGHGLPVAVGMAYAKKLKKEDGRIFVLISDGELQEGTTWESLNLTKKFNLDNLIIIIDNNRLQALEETKNVIDIDYKILYNFGMVLISDGHDINLIESAINHPYKGVKIINAITTKGKGVLYMENKPEWHAKMPTEEEYKIACEELSGSG